MAIKKTNWIDYVDNKQQDSLEPAPPHAVLDHYKLPFSSPVSIQSSGHLYPESHGNLWMHRPKRVRLPLHAVQIVYLDRHIFSENPRGLVRLCQDGSACGVLFFCISEIRNSKLDYTKQNSGLTKNESLKACKKRRSSGTSVTRLTDSESLLRE
jgi:hypothetical protein